MSGYQGGPVNGQQLGQAVAQLAANTPYTVQPTDTGFDVHLNLADAQWYAFFNKAGLQKTFVHHVACNDTERTFAITDEERTVEWRAGTNGISAPSFGKVIAKQSGTIKTVQYEKTFAFNDKGEYGAVVDYKFSSEEGRRLIKQAAQETGWTQKMGATTKVGLIAGLVGLLIALAVGVALLVVLL